MLGLAAIPFLALRAALPITPVENAANPRHLIAAVPPELIAAGVQRIHFWRAADPGRDQAYIDGRADMYGDAFVTDYNQITQGDTAKFNRAVDAMASLDDVPPSNQPLIQALDASPRWRRI